MKKRPVLLFLFVMGLFLLLILLKSMNEKDIGLVEEHSDIGITGNDAMSKPNVEFEVKREKIQESPIQNETKNEKKIISWPAAFRSSINFWGRVIDQEGVPVKGATINVIVEDDSSWSFNGGQNTKYSLIADSGGYFKVLNKRGVGITVEALASGYTSMYGEDVGTNLSKANISYVGRDDNMRNPRPTSNKPTILTLRKKQKPAKVDYVIKRNVGVPRDGTLQVLSFKKKNLGMVVEIRLWSSVPKPFTYDRYDWRAEIKVNKAIIKPIEGFNSVKAPENGYSLDYEIKMLSNTKRNWLRTSPPESKDFWVKLENGSYGKLRINITTGREHKVSVESWYNLEGNRNFEK